MKLSATIPSQLNRFQRIYSEACPGCDPPPTVEDIVECLANLAINRERRIRELERHLENLLRLGEKV